MEARFIIVIILNNWNSLSEVSKRLVKQVDGFAQQSITKLTNRDHNFVVRKIKKPNHGNLASRNLF